MAGDRRVQRELTPFVTREGERERADMKKFTVVGRYEDNGQTYIEHVEASGPIEAADTISFDDYLADYYQQYKQLK